MREPWGGVEGIGMGTRMLVECGQEQKKQQRQSNESSHLPSPDSCSSFDHIAPLFAGGGDGEGGGRGVMVQYSMLPLLSLSLTHTSSSRHR